jgi:hypothetical protein
MQDKKKSLSHFQWPLALKENAQHKKIVWL